jgi:hypothetical protein
MRFRGILRSKNVAKLGVWLTDAHQSGLYAMQRFARTLRVKAYPSASGPTKYGDKRRFDR